MLPDPELITLEFCDPNLRLGLKFFILKCIVIWMGEGLP